jgi:methyl-accepting chemotaxis protein
MSIKPGFRANGRSVLNALRQLKIGKRLSIVFATIIALMIVVGGYGAVNSTHLAAELDASAQTDLTAITLVAALGHDAGVVARASREMLLMDAAGPLKQQRELLVKALKSGDAHLEKLSSASNGPDISELLAKVKASKERFLVEINKYLAHFDAGDPDEARTALINHLRPVQAAYDGALDTLTDAIIERANARAAKGRQLASDGTKFLLLLCTAGVAIAVAAAVAITRSIVAPLRSAIEVARQIEVGDLSARVDTAHDDEVGQLLAAMARMQSHLTVVIKDVHRTAHDVSVSTDEIASSNADLSMRTERASASLQQASAAMHQIAQTVSDSSAKSKEASESAQTARIAVVQGGELVDELVRTMNRIAESSERIKDITSLIDGIAFQTNLLALNAAVEAARAGEQGRGFAVVAGEVRSLASRAAAAAKEIKSLIDKSGENVADGTKTVTITGKRIQEIVARVIAVRQLIEEVSISAQNQEAGIGSVNATVVDLDQSTQKNAALVEELAASTESLKGNARHLVETVNFFKVPAEA